MNVTSYKDYCYDKYRDEDTTFLLNRKLLIHKQLARPARTYVVYSDLHGSYDKYLYWLKNGMGYFKISVTEILGASYSSHIYESYERLLLLVNRTRVDTVDKFINGELDAYDPQHYFYESVPKTFIDCLDDLEKYGLTKRRIINDLLVLLRNITRGDEHRIIKAVPPMFLENILKLYMKKDRPSYESMLSGIIENEKVYHVIVSLIVKLVLVNMFDKHINLGDTFDRGDGADKLLKLYRNFFGRDRNAPPLHYLWGNHDILWLGASVGNPVLCATALRISMRYNNVDFLFRYGFNIDKLKAYALSCYKGMPSGSYIKGKDFSKWPKDVAAKMTKVLMVLEAKLTVSYLKKVLAIKGEIDYREVYDYYLGLLKLVPTGISEDLEEIKKFMGENPLYTDVFFPTVDPKNPEILTDGEQEVLDDLVKQFTSLPKLQDDIKWMFAHGEMYRVTDNTLYYHAALPSTDYMALDEIKGLKGKDLLDFIQRDLKRIGEKHAQGEEVSPREKMLFWYLWSGKESPFFCKSKMATLERAIFDKEEASKDELTTWEETPNPYYKNIRNDSFLSQILTEFHADKICMGHTPVRSMKQGILSDNLRAFIIDGGASTAYGDRGAILINTPDYTYVTFHPALEELKEAERKNCLPAVKITPLVEYKPAIIKDMDKGYFLKTELEALDQLIDEKFETYYSEYFI